jgi:hypothetical protein
MIIKREKRKKDAPGRAKHVEVEDIAEYVVGMDEGGYQDSEKVVYHGARGFLTDDFAAQVAEMIVLAEEATRSPMPVHHWVMSWREGEQPSPAQVDRAVEVFLKQLGVEDHQVIYGLHNDTDNVHLHLAINMVHPDTHKVVFVRNDYNRAQQVAALLEHEQGWQAEAGGWWRVNAQGELEQRAGPSEYAKPSPRAERMETWSGEKSAQRIAVEEAAPAMLRATSWAELHQHLADAGIRFERKGSGAVLHIGDTVVKASQADRKCSIGALEKRLGPFEPPSAEVLASVKQRQPQPVSPMPRSAGWEEYTAERQEHYRTRAAAFSDYRDRFKREWLEMVGRHRHARQAALAGSWKGRGGLLNEARSRLAVQQAVEKIELKERRDRARRLLREKFPRFPRYEEWLRKERGAELAEDWRYRDRGAPASIRSEDQPPADDTLWKEHARDIRDFEAQRRGWDVEYRRRAKVDPSGNIAFVDRGRKVDVFDHRDRPAVLAALQLAAEKWYGKFEVQGDDRYKRLCVELAVENGWTITNPELQRAVVDERAYRQDRQRQVPWSGSGALRPEGPIQPAPALASTMRLDARTPGERASPAAAYRRHFVEVRGQDAGADVSRVDARAAVRMRLTGHGRKSIEQSVWEAAPALRPGEKRDWHAYAKRVARFAFSRPGSQDADELESKLDQLFELEGRSPSRVPPAERDQRSDKPQPDPGRGGRSGAGRGGRGDE